MKQNEIEMCVAGLVLDPATNAPIVILKDPAGDLCLPIWIGLAEATSIASALKKVELARPMTHDLLATIIEDLGGIVSRIVISDLKDSTFIATIEVRVGDRLKLIDARPSDAIALGIRVDAAIYVTEEVLSQAQVALIQVSGDELDSEKAEQRARFVETEGGSLSNIDRDKWEKILSELDPEDFKYKM